MTLDFFSIFRDNAERFPDRVAFVNLTRSGRETYTYRQLEQEVRLLSRYLQQQGVREGNTVAILMENHPRWGIAFIAAQSVGAIVLPLDILHTPETLAGLIAHAECDFLISSAKMLETLDQIQAQREQPLPTLVLGDKSGAYPAWDEVLGGEAAGIALPLVERSLDEPALVMYTSGTTGDPKGVILTRRAMFRNIVEILKIVEISDQDNFLGVLPLYHILALMVNFLAPLFTGSRMTFLDVLEAQLILKTFKEEGITIFVCVPQFYYLVHRRIMSEVEKQPWAARFVFGKLYSFSAFANRRLGLNPGRFFFGRIHKPFGSLRIFAVGGARLDEEVALSFRNLGFTLLQAYGLTETAAIVTLAGFDPKAVGSVGKALPHARVRIEQPDDGGIGEVVVWGESIMKGYLRRPDATAEVLDEDGWLYTGDLGYLTPAGYLYITGRKKDVIVLSSGKNIYPEEIEESYQKYCSYIQEICVVGISDPDQAQERLHAVVVPDFEALKAGQIVNAYEMIRHMMENISQKLPSHKRVRSFDISQEPLPRTTTRKIKRHEVERLVREGIEDSESAALEPDQPSDSVEEKVFEAVHHVKPDAVITLSGNLELDLGLDSLERVEFLSGLQESTGVSFTDEEATGLLTVSDVIGLTREKLASGEATGASVRRSWAEILDEPLNEADAAMVKGRLRRRPIMEFLFVLFALVNYIFFKILFRMRVEGIENLPRKYPYLLCPNHESFLDAFVAGAPLPARSVPHLFALAYADYFEKGPTAFLGRLVKVIPVSPDRHLRQALRLAAEGLRQGLVLMVFPEGERTIDGQLKVFRRGPAILATSLKIPVVPVGIDGTFEIWRRASNKIRLHPIKISYGKPLTPEQCETADAFNERLRQAVAELIE